MVADTAQVIFVSYAWDKWDHFFLRKQGRSYAWDTNLPIKKETLWLILILLDRNGVDIDFAIQTLFRESRIGIRTDHKPNRDGSIDGGWWGLNSRYHPIEHVGDPIQDTFTFIDYYRKNILPYPREEWHIRYVYGEAKARKLRLIK